MEARHVPILRFLEREMKEGKGALNTSNWVKSSTYSPKNFNTGTGKVYRCDEADVVLTWERLQTITAGTTHLRRLPKEGASQSRHQAMPSISIHSWPWLPAPTLRPLSPPSPLSWPPPACPSVNNQKPDYRREKGNVFTNKLGSIRSVWIHHLSDVFKSMDPNAWSIIN